MVHHLIHRFGLVTMLLAVGLPGCGRSSPDTADRGSPSETAATAKASANASRVTSTPAAGRLKPGLAEAPQGSSDFTSRLLQPGLSPGQLTEEPAWLAAAREDPDPRVRLGALDFWAQRPGESLNPLTYALVDPDESVRARAQELLEQELERR